RTLPLACASCYTSSAPLSKDRLPIRPATVGTIRRAMRVVLNQHAAFGPRTGIGHYTGQLLHCLRELTEPGEIDARPGSWLNGLRQFFVRHSRSALPGPSGVTWRGRLNEGAARLLRAGWRTLMTFYFRRVT